MYLLPQKTPKPMRLAQGKFAKAAVQSASSNVSSIYAVSASSNRGEARRVETSNDKVVVVLSLLKDKMVEDRVNVNANFGEMQATQEVLVNEVRQLQKQSS